MIRIHDLHSLHWKLLKGDLLLVDQRPEARIRLETLGRSDGDVNRSGVGGF